MSGATKNTRTDRKGASVKKPQGAFTRVIKNPIGAVCAFILAVVVMIAVLAPLLATHDPNISSVADVLLPQSPEHILGTDSSGRDVFSRLVWAARYSLLGGVLSLVVAALIGITAGLLAGYFGGWFDMLSSWMANLLMAMPAVIILLAVRAVTGPSLWIMMALLGVLLSPAFFRLVYSAVRGVRNELYVDAARVSGLSDPRIISRHILAVVRAPIIIQGAMVLGISIGIQAGLDFLGLGDTTLPTWGSLLNDGFANIYMSPLLLLWPAIMVVLTCVALTMFANVLRDEMQGTGSGRAKKLTMGAAATTTLAAIRHPETEPVGSGPESVPMLDIRGLSIAYPQKGGTQKVVVEDVSLQVRRGEIHGLVGESGSGKTQTAWAVLGLLGHGGQIIEGSVTFDGVDLATLTAKKMQKVRGKRIAYVPQEPMSNLDPSFTIGSQMVEPMRACLGISKKEATARALELLAKVGIRDPKRTFNSYPHQISGGMAQRVLIAGAISCEPELLIADEPTTALDVTVQAEILELLRSLHEELNMVVILVTHDLGVVADICDRVSVMRNGQVIEVGSVRDIFNNPLHPYTQRLVSVDEDYQKPRGPLEESVEVAEKAEVIA